MAADGSMASLDALCRPLLERLSELGVQVSSSDARVLVLTALVWCGLHITGRRKKMASEHITQSVPPTDCGEALEEDEELFFAESAKVWAQIEAERAGCIPLVSSLPRRWLNRTQNTCLLPPSRTRCTTQWRNPTTRSLPE